MLQILFITHEDAVPSGVLGVVAREQGHDVHEWSFRDGTPPPLPFDEYQAIVVLGGSMHPDADADHPWLATERAVLRRALERSTPMLGVCLGAQLLVQAAGGSVTRAAQPEIGWRAIEVAEAAQDDAVLGAANPVTPVFQWHFYRFGAPPAATPLAFNDAGLQAWRLGSTVWGVQFHPEVDDILVTLWLDRFGRDPGLEQIGAAIPAIRAQTPGRIGGSMRLGRSIAEGFLGAAATAGAQTACSRRALGVVPYARPDAT